MKILRKDENQNLIINKEHDFQNDLGWQENMIQFEDEVLSTIINPIENYETVRYIHKPYNTTVSGLTFSQTDIWYNFYFVSGTSYTQDYNVVGIDTHENAKMLKQATQSFFRLEFYKTPKSGSTYEPPTRVNRKLSFAKNLALPLGEKYFYTGNNINEDIFFPVFMGSNYRNKENMYLFWFQDESVLSETVLSGDTFWMTAKFFNANDGTIIDFVNRPIYSNVEINEANDMYYKLVIDRTDYSYQYFRYTGTTGDRVGESIDSIKFYERKGIPVPTSTPTPTPTNTPTPTPTPSSTPTPTPTSTPTPTPTSTGVVTPPTLNYYNYSVTRSSIPNAAGGFFTYTASNGLTQTILQDTPGVVGTFCMLENSYLNNQYNLYTISQVGICNGVAPTFYYYALGDCTQIKYSYTAVTSVGFGVGYVKVTGCNIFSEPVFDPLTSYYYDFDDPCGFTTGYTIGYVRSSTQLTEGDVYNYNDGCYSIVQIPEGYVPTSYIESTELGSKVTSSNPCQDCQPPYTGFSQFYAYDGIVCGTNPAQQTIVLSIFPYVEGNQFSLDLNTTYAVIEYDDTGTLTSDGYCVTVTGYSGPFSGQTVSVPMFGTDPITYENRPVGPNVVGGGDISSCGDCNLYYNLETVRCDGQVDLVSSPIWSQQKLNVNDVVTTSLNDNVCRKVISVWGHKFKPYKSTFQDAPVYVSGVFSGGTATVNCQSCTTAGGSGGNVGGTGNVVSVSPTMGTTTSGNDTCQDGTPYNSYSADVTFTFNGASGPVTPDTVVEYSINGSSYSTLTITGTTYVQTMYSSDQTPCGGSNSVDNIRIKVNNVLLINYDLGS